MRRKPARCRPEPRGPLRRAWAAVRRRLSWLRPPEPPPEPPWWPEEPALVPTGPPRRRPPAGAVALDLPTELDPLVYPTEIEAVGEPLPPAEGEGSRSRGWGWFTFRWLRRSLPVG